MAFWTSWRRKKAEEAKPDHTSSTLPDFVRGIQHAVNAAMLMYEQNCSAFLDRHFKDDGSPEFKLVKLPGGKHQLFVPTITTTRPPDMILDEMEVKMSVRIDKAQVKAGHPKGDPDVTRSSFQVSLAAGKEKTGNSNEISLVMKFKRGDPPEGVARIAETFMQMIVPMEKPPEGATPITVDPEPSKPPPPVKDETTVIVRPQETPAPEEGPTLG